MVQLVYFFFILKYNAVRLIVTNLTNIVCNIYKLPYLSIPMFISILKLRSKTKLQTVVYDWSFYRQSSIKIDQDGYRANILIILREMSLELYQTQINYYN